jgi:hypothetical protein
MVDVGSLGNAWLRLASPTSREPTMKAPIAITTEIAIGHAYTFALEKLVMTSNYWYLATVLMLLSAASLHNSSRPAGRKGA